MRYIDKFIGEWQNEFGNRLEIRKQSDQSAIVSFFSGKDNKPVLKLSTKIIHQYKCLLHLQILIHA